MNHADGNFIAQWLTHGNNHTPEFMESAIGSMHLPIDTGARAQLHALMDAVIKFTYNLGLLNMQAIMARIDSLNNNKIGTPLKKMVLDILMISDNLEGVRNNGPIGWTIENFAYQPGLSDRIPEQKANTVRVFGNIPSSQTIIGIIHAANMHPDHYDTIEIFVMPPGVQIQVIGYNADGITQSKIIVQ